MGEKTVDLLVGPEQQGMRLDVCLGKSTQLPTRNACVHLIEEGKVLLNGVVATSKKEKLALGDRLLITYTPVDPDAPKLPILPNPIPLDIRYEDNTVIVLSKQKGLVCHPSPGHVDDTLANALVARYGFDNLGHLQGVDRPGIVHRLDMDTTGLMLAAKTNEVQKALQDLIRLRTLDRRYIALVHGFVAPDEGQIVAPIARSRKNRLMMAVSDAPGARDAITTFKTLARFGASPSDDGYSLLECHLYTGRTHQIRVHMRHTGHPCVGDPLYGRGSEKMNQGLDRQFLHSWYVKFLHPETGVPVELQDRLPQDLHDVLESLQDKIIDKTQEGQRILTELGF